jgi:hypothetical protein
MVPAADHVGQKEPYLPRTIVAVGNFLTVPGQRESPKHLNFQNGRMPFIQVRHLLPVSNKKNLVDLSGLTYLHDSTALFFLQLLPT